MILTADNVFTEAKLLHHMDFFQRFLQHSAEKVSDTSFIPALRPDGDGGDHPAQLCGPVRVVGAPYFSGGSVGCGKNVRGQFDAKPRYFSDKNGEMGGRFFIHTNIQVL